MGVGLGIVIAACVVHPDKPIIHVSGDPAIGFSGMEMETHSCSSVCIRGFDFPFRYATGITTSDERRVIWTRGIAGA